MKFIKKLLYQTMICIILFLIMIIFIKRDSTFKTKVYKKVYEDSISFGYLNSLYTKYFGSLLPFKLDIGTKPVFNETLSYTNKNMYKDGAILEVDNNYLIPTLDNGLVVFIGDKDNYGKVIIMEQENGVEVWYGNINNPNVKLYDYVKKGTYLGNTIDNKLYLVFKKDGQIVNYEDYLN